MMCVVTAPAWPSRSRVQEATAAAQERSDGGLDQCGHDDTRSDPQNTDGFTDGTDVECEGQSQKWLRLLLYSVMLYFIFFF